MAVRKVPRLDMEATYMVAKRPILMGNKTYQIGSTIKAALLPKNKVRIFLEYGFLLALPAAAAARAPEPAVAAEPAVDDDPRGDEGEEDTSPAVTARPSGKKTRA